MRVRLCSSVSELLYMYLAVVYSVVIHDIAHSIGAPRGSPCVVDCNNMIQGCCVVYQLSIRGIGTDVEDPIHEKVGV